MLLAGVSVPRLKIDHLGEDNKTSPMQFWTRGIRDTLAPQKLVWSGPLFSSRRHLLQFLFYQSLMPKRWLQLERLRDAPCKDFRVAYLAATARLQGWQRNMTMFGCPDRKMPISNPYCHTPVPQEKHCQRHSGPNNWLSDLTLCNWTRRIWLMQLKILTHPFYAQ